MISETAAKLPAAYLRAFFVPAALWTGFILAAATRFKHFPQELLSRETDTLQLYAIVYFVGVLLLSFVLEVMNFTIIQAYEGIAPAALAACLKPLRGRAVKRFESSQAKIKKLMDKDPDKAYEVEHQLLLSFPSQVEDILPTRLGNIIAAFEHYPYRRYGIDAITIWPRLQTVISNEQRKRIASAKSEFDFWINCSVLFLFAAIAFLLFLGKYGGGLTYWLTPAVCLLISTVSYQASLGFAVSWGETVKAAFDVHRFHLLKALGAKPVKGTLTAAEEQQIWRELQWSMKYRYLPDSKIVEFELPPDKKAESEKD